MSQPFDETSLARARYEGDVAASAWREKGWLEQALRIVVTEVALLGRWPKTELRVRWLHGGREGEITAPIYRADGERRGDPDQVGADVLDMVIGNE
jgi:hypothetical protein